ncbi:alcohol dehydrogenase [Fusarium tjaetaba]|uniref:Alcohol dehydrogenase n=1 Tax=Fusarium tjaetaba TaxID=1567544 RepID=A0A8H5S8J1_9HYPO|nr:alcohol dehydrogenase [Fusarium tjaetaba]KAF5646424.1 alcohol dehydrogenase [Fusarium tjaetaba]
MSRYAAAHEDPQGPGDARPTALQIIKDEGVEGKLKGKVIVITGTSSGIGIETARALAETGAKLFLTARNLDKAKKACAEFFDASRMEFIELDLTSFDSVRAAAKSILDKTDKINILVENAGCMAVPELELTKDGHEMQFGVNYLAHFLFFELLKPALLAAVTPELNSRVVVLSSSAHQHGGINESDNYNFQKGGYDPWRSYGQSKTADIYLANEIDRRYGSRGLHATSVHPGGIMTELSRYIPPEVLQTLASSDVAKKMIKSPEQGAATTVWAAIGKQWEKAGGKYLENCQEAPPAKQIDPHFGKGYAPHAYDPEREARLWKDALKIVGLA